MLMGMMQHSELTTGMLIDHAAHAHGATEIVSRDHDGSIVRSTWGSVAARARRVAGALHDLGAKRDDRVATLAWNRVQHLELYYGISAAGMVLHTVNPRLFPDQIAFILNHGGAEILFVDPDLLPSLIPLLPALETIRTLVVLGPEGDWPLIALSYEVLLAGTTPLESWPTLDENAAAALCYTSGTTGDPKGVLYSHRSSVLHAFCAVSADGMALSARDTILVATPLFHVNAWGIPFAAAMCGSKLVLPGPMLDGPSIFALLRDERCTFSLGVPTVWFALLDYIAINIASPAWSQLSLQRVLVGGAAVPAALIERFHAMLGVDVIQAWGMTETSPLATICRPTGRHRDLDQPALQRLAACQGRPAFGIELRIEDGQGRPIAPGSGTAGTLKVRGPWVINGYFGGAAGEVLDERGWFDTGDIARIDADGFLHLTDRAKDMIKSGGEWISSIDLENAAVAHPSVAEAAVIAMPHPKWQERPLMLVRLHPGAGLDNSELNAFLADRVAKWWLPERIVFVDALPHSATGKLLKTELRRRYLALTDEA
jgi:fatty-acyl-CoA synthase